MASETEGCEVLAGLVDQRVVVPLCRLCRDFCLRSCNECRLRRAAMLRIEQMAESQLGPGSDFLCT